MNDLDKEAVANQKHNMATFKINTILTFFNKDADGDEQLCLSIEVPIAGASAKELLDTEFFPEVGAALAQAGRERADLCKISTSANWDLWETETGYKSTEPDQINGKWYFNIISNPDLSSWEHELIAKYSFGKNEAAHASGKAN